MKKIQTTKKQTIVGTDIEEVKQLNQESGLSYNEVKELLARRWMNNNPK